MPETTKPEQGKPLFEDGVYTCAGARRIIGKVLAGKGVMRYTRAAIGKGVLEEGMDPALLDEPPGYVMDGAISSVSDPVDGECQVSIQANGINNDGDSFYATCIMLYARDPETDEDVPYAYMSMEETPEVIRSRNTAVGKLAMFDMITVVDEVESVTATIDPNALVTRAEVERLIADSNRRTLIQIPATGWKATGAGSDLPSAPESDAVEDGNSTPILPGPGLDTGADGAASGYAISIPVEHATEESMPTVFIARSSRDTAAACGLDDTCESREGEIVLFAQEKPATNMTATLVLQRTADAA